MAAAVFPSSDESVDVLNDFFETRPVTQLSTVEIIVEAQHWESELASLRRKLAQEGKEKRGAKGARWGGAATAAASFPAAFAIPAVGIAVALVGGAALLYGEYHRRRALEIQETIDGKYTLIDKRKNALRAEQDQRTLTFHGGI